MPQAGIKFVAGGFGEGFRVGTVIQDCENRGAGAAHQGGGGFPACE